MKDLQKTKPIGKETIVEAIMETLITSPFLQLIFLALLLILSVSCYRTSKAKEENLPPGPWKLPIIGDMHQLLVGSELPHRIITKLAKKHGPLMHLKLGEISTLIVSSPRMASEVMKQHDIALAQRPQVVVAKIMSYQGTGIVFSPYGDYWREIRKTIMQEMLSSKKVKSFSSVWEEEILNLIQSIRWSSLGKKVNLSGKLGALTTSVICRVLFGAKYEDEDAFIYLAKVAKAQATGFNFTDYFPSIKLLRALSGLEKKMMMLHMKTDKILERIITEHKNKEVLLGESLEKENMLDVLLRLQRTSDLSITDDNIKAILSDIFAAGSDNLLVAAEWTLSELIRNPRVMGKAQAEVRQALEGRTHFSEKDIETLSYLKAVIKETLRLRPPGPLLFPRECRKPCVIDGYNIPLGTRVVVNVWAINRDPEYWDDAECFYPERFMSNTSIDFRGNNFEYIPFGAGRRMCPGVEFGMANLELLLAQLLYHFNWELPGGRKPEELDMDEVFGLSVGRKNGLELIATPYI